MVVDLMYFKKEISIQSFSTMLHNYLTIAFRNLWRNKALSFINISGLSIGLACCMLIFLYTKDEISYDAFHDKKQQLYRLSCKIISKERPEEKFGIASMVQGVSFKKEIPEIHEIVRFNTWDVVIKKGAETFNERLSWADDNFFTVFSFPLVSGSPKTALKELNSLVLTEEMALKYFGTTNAIGKTLEVKINDEFEPYVITGIAKKCPQNSSIQFKILNSFKHFEKINSDEHWFNLSFPTFLS